MADILRLAVTLPTITDVFLKDQQLVPFLRRCCNIDSDHYLQVVRLLLGRYCELEKASLTCINIFEFGRFFEPLVEFMRTLLTELLKRPATCESLQTLTALCDSPSMYLTVSRQLPAIIEVATLQLEAYTGTINSASPENFREVINY